MLRRYVQLTVLPVFIVICSLSIPAASFADEVDFLDDDFYSEESEGTIVPDPIEPLNRAFFEFNDVTYTYVMKPVARGYGAVLPADIRGCVWNFFRNLQEPIRFVNCLLQGRVEQSGWVMSRFFINTVCGVFGLGDPATREFGIPPINASLGETFATWGVGDGFYMVVPLFGPSTLTDFTGSAIENLTMSPYYLATDDFWALAAIHTTREINNISLNINVYDDMKALSFDPYIAIRNGYFQNRKKLRDHSEFNVDW